MENSQTKYLDLVEAGKIDPNEPIKRFPLYTKKQLKQIAYEVGLWAIDIEQLKQLKKNFLNEKPTDVEFKEKFDNWIDDRLKLIK